jgi:outer membrane protein TolC
LCYLALIFFLAAVEVSAQPRVLSLSTAIAAALENNANVEIAEAQAVEASARADEQRGLLLPNVQAQAGYVNQVVNCRTRSRFRADPQVSGGPPGGELVGV